MSHPASNTKSVLLVQKALKVYAREIGADPADLETVMTEFLVGMMVHAEREEADFSDILAASKAQNNGGF